MSDFFLGIDGGGTKTEALLCDSNGDCLFHTFDGSSNPNDIGVDNSLNVLSKIIESAIRSINLSDIDKIYIFCGVSGALNHKSEMADDLSERFPKYNISIDSDVMNVINAELGQREGVCVICGTGSVCFVRAGKKLIRIGGWGYLLDSAGSGYNLGRDAIESVLMAEDGRGETTLLCDIMKTRIGKDVIDSISEIYDGGKTYIASFAECVFEGYIRKDWICKRIIEKNAFYIAEMLNAAGNYLKKPFCAIMNGGINTSFTEIWFENIKKYIPDSIELKLASNVPVCGALCGAFELSGSTLSEKMKMSINKYVSGIGL